MNVLYDDAEYSKRLTAAGVENELFLSKGALHGFFTFPGIDSIHPVSVYHA